MVGDRDRRLRLPEATVAGRPSRDLGEAVREQPADERSLGQRHARRMYSVEASGADTGGPVRRKVRRASRRWHLLWARAPAPSADALGRHGDRVVGASSVMAGELPHIYAASRPSADASSSASHCAWSMRSARAAIRHNAQSVSVLPAIQMVPMRAISCTASPRSPLCVSSLREHPSGLTNGGCYFFGMPGPHECARLRIANPAVRRRHRVAVNVRIRIGRGGRELERQRCHANAAPAIAVHTGNRGGRACRVAAWPA
jgi:hypothetical protein